MSKLSNGQHQELARVGAIVLFHTTWNGQRFTGTAKKRVTWDHGRHHPANMSASGPGQAPDSDTISEETQRMKTIPHQNVGHHRLTISVIHKCKRSPNPVQKRATMMKLPKHASFKLYGSIAAN